MRHKNSYLKSLGIYVLGTLALGALHLGGPAGCGSSSAGGGGGTGSGTGNISSLTVRDETSTGDFTPAVTYYATTGNGLGIRANGVDVNGDGTPGTATITGTTAEVLGAALIVDGSKDATAADLKCIKKGVEDTGIASTIGLGISLDTTASMGSEVGPFASAIAKLASDLTAKGFTGAFSGITNGDAYATKDTSGSSYTDGVSQGDKDAPPSFDTVERPDTGTNPVSSSDEATFFNKVADVVGSGDSGGDSTENYLGSLLFLNDEVAWSSETQKILISVGDNCAHTVGSVAAMPGGGFDPITDKWMPPAKADVEGRFTNAIVHVIGPDVTGGSFTCADGSLDYSMQDLATKTGGTFTDIDTCRGGNETACIDAFLAKLNLSISDHFNECDYTGTAGETLVRFCSTVEMDDGTTFSAVKCTTLALTLL